MKSNKKIVFITILIFIALSGLVMLQIYFLNNAREQKEQAFERNVLIALNNAVQAIENSEAVRGIIQSAIQDSLFAKNHRSDSLGKANRFFVEQRDIRRIKPGETPKEIFAKRGYLKNEPLPVRTDFQFNVLLRVGDSIKVIDSSIIENHKGNVNTGSQAGTSGAKFFYQYSTDSSSYFIQSINGKKVSIMLRELPAVEKEKMITRVMDRLILADRAPIEKRVRLSNIDSLLKQNLHEVGINLPYKFGVLTGNSDSLKLAFSGVYKDELGKSKLKARLFPSDYFSSPNILAVSFPNRDSMILKEISPLLALSFIFILIIGVRFIYTLKTIYKQKKFSTLIVDFINNMTHEFKTPISTISLASEALSNPQILEDKNKLLRYNQVIKEENNRMRQQVEKILQMAVLEEGDYELDIREIDIEQVITQAAHNALLQIEGAGGRLNLNLLAENHMVMGDIVHITNILHNILDNAIKYSLHKIEIDIFTENQESSLLIKISDKGPGMREEDLKRVFEKYYRVPTGNTHDTKGFGLGLSYVKMMVTAHKGTIEINSKYGKGTTVEIALPIKNQVHEDNNGR